MREIKFRWWDKEEKEFNKPWGFRSDVDISVILQSCFEDHIPTQYTGLKDKNGVEIYEGDILGYFDAIVNNDKERTEIKWAKAYSGEQWCEFNIRDYNGKDVKSDEPNDYYGGIHPEYKEVIGNIFEGVDK